MLIDFNSIDAKQRYKLISGSVVPRPIAWIVSQDNGVLNVAPFSYFTPLSSNPATCIVSIGHKLDGSKKDTLHNILTNKKATICFVDIVNLEDMDKTAESLPKDISEIEKFNLETVSIKDDYPPIIKNTKSAMFCDFYEQINLPGKTIPIILEIKYQYFEDALIDSQMGFKLENIGRLGLSYTTTQTL